MRREKITRGQGRTGYHAALLLLVAGVLLPFWGLLAFTSSVLRSRPGHAQTRTSKQRRPRTWPLTVTGEMKTHYNTHTHRERARDKKRDVQSNKQQILTGERKKRVKEGLTRASPGSGWSGWADGSSHPCSCCCTCS